MDKKKRGGEEEGAQLPRTALTVQSHLHLETLCDPVLSLSPSVS